MSGISATNLDELRRSQESMNASAEESFTQYTNADNSVQDRVGESGDGSLSGKIGNYVNSQWDEDTRQAVESYKAQAQHLLNDAINSISAGASTLMDEVNQMYK